MYADHTTNSIKNAMEETNRRRELQMEFNLKNNITPRTINKAISDILYSSGIRSDKSEDIPDKKEKKKLTEARILKMDPGKIANIISGLEEEMYLEARELNFENAAAIRDEIKRIKKITNIETDLKKPDERRNIRKRRKRA
jgi:excinuclease ABC subunit B